MPITGTSDHSLLLLSGGHDSIALAAWVKPGACLSIDYGQLPAEGELRAAAAAAKALDLPWHTLQVDLTPVGSGLLHRGETVNASLLPDSPSPEWWPYRNQLLVSLAAAWALPRVFKEIVVGTVKSDGARHRDGTTGFYERLDDLLSFQEGLIRVVAPAINMTTIDLISVSRVPDDILGFAHSCHVATYPCGACPGCRKHEDVLAKSGRFK